MVKPVDIRSPALFFPFESKVKKSDLKNNPSRKRLIIIAVIILVSILLGLIFRTMIKEVILELFPEEATLPTNFPPN